MRRSRPCERALLPLPLELRAGLVLAAIAAALFGWHRVAEGLREEGRNECRQAAAAELKENTDALSRIADKARADQFAHESAAAGARAAAERLRGAVAGSGLVIRAAAAGASAPEPVSPAGDLPARLLDGCVDIARYADCLASGGEACERSYGALTR